MSQNLLAAGYGQQSTEDLDEAKFPVGSSTHNAQRKRYSEDEINGAYRSFFVLHPFVAMFETAQLIQSAQWLGIATIACGVLALLAFVFKWGIRFRLVGATGFMIVLTAGVLALSVSLYSRPTIPDAVKYSRIYDTGAAEVVIAVAPQITEPQIKATLQQAAIDLFSPGRLGGKTNQMRIRVRTVLHPQPGVSQPLYLGEVQRSLAVRNDEYMTVKLYSDQIAQLQNPTA